MTALENFTQLAAKYSDNQANRLAYHVGLLEAHIRHQDQLLETFQQELDQIIIEMHKEQA
jgi:hypothetical protein